MSKIARILKVAAKISLLVIGGYMLYLVSFCVMYPNTAINRLSPLYLDRGLHPADVANDEGNVEFCLGKNGPRFELPVGYMWSTIRPEMDLFKVSFDYETLQPASLYSKNPKHISVQISQGSGNRLEVNKKDFLILKKNDLLERESDNVWHFKLQNSLDFKRKIDDIKVSHRYHWRGREGEYIFLVNGDGSITMVDCAVLCSIRENIKLDGHGYALVYGGFPREEIPNLHIVLQQTKKFIQKYRKD